MWTCSNREIVKPSVLRSLPKVTQGVRGHGVLGPKSPGTPSSTQLATSTMGAYRQVLGLREVIGAVS